MKVLVGIPTTNLWNKYTKNALDSLLKCKGEFDIFLLDNASDDETQHQGKFYCDDNKIIYQRNLIRNSCAGSWNQIAKYGMDNDYELIGIFNDDVLFNKNTISILIERFEVDPLLSNSNNEAVLISCTNIRGELKDPNEIIDWEDTREIVEESEHPDYSGFMINRKLIEEVGYFDSENFFPVYFEDNDSHYRINLAGFKAICYPRSVYYHFGSATGVGQGISNGTLFEANRKRYVDKWGGLPGEEKFGKPFNK